jgi:hypothetical protein
MTKDEKEERLQLHLSLLFAHLLCYLSARMVLRLELLLVALARALVAEVDSLVLKDAPKQRRHWVHCVRGVCHGGCWSKGGWGRRGAVVSLMPLTFGS